MIFVFAQLRDVDILILNHIKDVDAQPRNFSNCLQESPWPQVGWLVA